MNPTSVTLLPPSPLARRIPLTQHPSLVTLDKPNARFAYQNKSEDRFFLERNRLRAEGRSDDTKRGGDEVEWAAWYELRDGRDKLKTTMMPFLADSMRNMPSLLPREQRPGPR